MLTRYSIVSAGLPCCLKKATYCLGLEEQHRDIWRQYISLRGRQTALIVFAPRTHLDLRQRFMLILGFLGLGSVFIYYELAGPFHRWSLRRRIQRYEGQW